MPIIDFRTSYASIEIGARKGKNSFSHNGEFDEIREYQGGDIRNIIWRKSTGNHIYEKMYDTHRGIDLHILYEDDISWGFQEGKYDISKYDWYDTLIRNSQESIRQIGGRFHTYHKSQKRKEYRNSLILFISSSLDISRYEDISETRKYNDTIIILLLHKRELYTIGNLYEGMKLGRGYEKQLKEKIGRLQSYLAKMNIPLIVAHTRETPSQVLHHFFKYRYAFR